MTLQSNIISVVHIYSKINLIFDELNDLIWTSKIDIIIHIYKSTHWKSCSSLFKHLMIICIEKKNCLDEPDVMQKG